jgi:hypothetical protein
VVKCPNRGPLTFIFSTHNLAHPSISSVSTKFPAVCACFTLQSPAGCQHRYVREFDDSENADRWEPEQQRTPNCKLLGLRSKTNSWSTR